jgi:hypothetical protein
MWPRFFSGFAVTVLHRGVEVVHAGGDRPGDCALLVERIAAHHQSANRAAAEAQHGELHSGAPEYPHCHRPSSHKFHFFATALACPLKGVPTGMPPTRGFQTNTICRTPCDRPDGIGKMCRKVSYVFGKNVTKVTYVLFCIGKIYFL